MYVEEVCIDGFKSYAQRTVVPAFDPLFNAITGLNGSGKSNILDAICFVLGITNLTQVRRRARLERRRSNVLFPFAFASFPDCALRGRSSFSIFFFLVKSLTRNRKTPCCAPRRAPPPRLRFARRLCRSSCTSKTRRA